MRDEQQRFDEVLDALERERQRIDEDLKRLTVAAAYLPAAAAPTTRETPVLGPQETTTAHLAWVHWKPGFRERFF
jgi:hypothetical protein